MLVKISVENFKSFDQTVELTMISSNKIRTNADHRLKIKSTPLLKYGVVYGANAAGKTNLTEFFHFFKECVNKGIPMESASMFCKNRKENREKESNFEIQLTLGDKFYAYGFSAVLSKRKITAEWLYELYQNGSSRRLFEREGKKRPILDETVTLTNTEKNKFEIYADDFEGNETSLFLTEMNRGKKYSERSKLLLFRDVYDWIQNHIVVITPHTPFIDFTYYYDMDSLELINKLIETFDTGIRKVEIVEISLDELANAMPKAVFENVMRHVKKRIEEKENSSFQMTMRSSENFFSIEAEGHSEPKVTTIRLKHEKSFYDFGFEEESDGTRRIFDLMDMLLNKKEDVLYVVDELERSLHPKLTERFLQLFMQLHYEERMQLLFTTHESAIMDQSLFRRDEIWFVERNAENASVIYSLDRFKERYDKVLSKAYLEGRYGAIPIFRSFEYGEEG
ncbi:MAG: AAA family ATPase [Eubacteriales bacterium]|nr:AAA family ATPase [Eubacteriales bacterium]